MDLSVLLGKISGELLLKASSVLVSQLGAVSLLFQVVFNTIKLLLRERESPLLQKM